MGNGFKYGKPVSDLTKSLEDEINKVVLENKSRTKGLGLNKAADAISKSNQKVQKKPRPPTIKKTGTKDRNDSLMGTIDKLKTRSKFWSNVGGSK